MQAATLVGAGLWLAGCASVVPQTPEQAITQRAAERWKLMMADKFDASYEYTAPSYRALKDVKAYRLNYGAAGGWTAAEVAKVTCASEASCTAVLKIAIKNPTPIRSLPTLTTALDEAWVLEDGRWYFLPPL
ncbi:hypothetical protein AAFF27_23855 [Xylophilus sp. GW821-FHT01B05]